MSFLPVSSNQHTVCDPYDLVELPFLASREESVDDQYEGMTGVVRPTRNGDKSIVVSKERIFGAHQNLDSFPKNLFLS